MTEFSKKLISFFIAVDSVFAAIVRFLLIASLLSMVALVVAQVVLRNFFNSGIPWADVAARHAVLWVAFLGAMLATRSRQHIAIDILMRFIPKNARNFVRIAIDALACVVTFMLARTSLFFVLDERALGSELFTGMPAWIAETIIPFGFAMISIEYAIGVGLDIWRIATSGHRDFEAGKGRG